MIIHSFFSFDQKKEQASLFEITDFVLLCSYFSHPLQRFMTCAITTFPLECLLIQVYTVASVFDQCVLRLQQSQASGYDMIVSVIYVTYLQSRGHNLGLREACTVMSFLNIMIISCS